MRSILITSLITLAMATTTQAQNRQTMKETKNITSHSGNPLTLLGEPTVVGEIAPDFTAVDVKGKEVKLSDFSGKTVVITVFPSIDTPVCASQTRHFNQDAASIGEDVVILTISKDLPFALGRFCAAEGIERVHPLSDYRQSEFGLKYGFLIKENMLLSRGTVVVDKGGKVVYAEYVDDITKEPNYEAVMAKLKSL